MISSPFPHHTIASLRQVGMVGLTPLLDFGKYQGRSFTSIQMFHTHTCSEIAYRIIDVECIVRAKKHLSKPDRNG